MTAIRVELELADGSFTTRMLHAGESVAQFTQNVTRSNPAMAQMAANGQNIYRSISKAQEASKGFMSTLRDVSIVTGLVSIGIAKIADIQHSWIGDIVRINAEMERLNFQMRSMSKAADPIKDAGDQVAFLREQALKMPFSLNAITNGFVKLKATGTDPLSGSLQAIADGVSAFGGNDEAFNRTILAISQMSGKGVIQMEELRQQLGESMPRAVELMARSMGVSMGQLIKDISSGTVQAKPALAQFYDELERTYGGRARYMMETFSGQYQQTLTSIQRLATSGTLKDNFFKSIKDQLKDLNSFLNSKAAQTFANDLGRGLTSAVGYLRTAINTVIEFRNEITRFAYVAAGAFAMKTAINGISNFMGALGSLRTELRAVALGFGESRSWFALFNQASFSAGTAAIGLQAGLRGVLASLAPIAAGIAAIAPWVTALGLATYAAGEYFGWFDNKVQNAYESLLKYGAETRRQAKETTDNYINALKQEIELEKQRVIARGDAGLKENDKGDLVPDESIGNLYTLNKRLAEAQEQQAKLIGEAGRREDEKAVESKRTALDEQFQILQGDRDRQLDVIREKYDAEEKTSKDTVALNQERAAEILKINQATNRQQIDIIRKAIADEKAAAVGLTGDKLETSRKVLDMLYNQLSDYSERLDNLKLGEVPTLKAPKSMAQMLENGQKKLRDLRADVDGLVGDFMGANKEVEELQSLLRQGKFGDMGRPEVQALTKDLLEAQAAKEHLDELMKGKKKLEDDIQQAQLRALDKQMELQEKAAGRDLSDAEKIKIRIENGYYDGFGPKSPTREMLRQMLQGFDAQASAAVKVSDIFQNDTFGAPTQNRIESVTQKLRDMAGVITGIGTGLNGLNFGKISMPGDAMFGGGGGRVTGSAGTLLDLIASRESGGDYNATLDNGQWTGGSQNLVNMTLNQILELQKMMLANPANRAKYDGIGSSALGRYQIVSSTLQGLIKEMGLSGEEKFDKDMQDRMGLALIDRRRNQGVEGLRKEWTGLQGVDPATIMAALSGQRYAAAQAPAQVAKTNPGAGYTPGEFADSFIDAWDNGKKKIAESLAKLQTDNLANEAGEKKQKLIDANKEIQAQIEAQKMNGDDLNKTYEKMIALIKQGKIGSGDKDPRAAEYKELLANAKQLDQVEKEAADRKKRLGSAERAEETLGQKKIDIARRVAEANARIADPLEQKTSQAFRAMRTELDDYLKDVEAYYGKDSTKYQQALAYKQQILKQFTNAETAEKAANWMKDAREIQRGLLTERQQRQQAMQEEIAQIDAMVAQFQGTEEEKVQIVAAAEAKKAAIRAEYAQQMDPMARQMQEWGDLQGNLAQASTQWMSSLADGLTGLITGTGDLKGVIDGILKDLINMGIKYILSQVMGAKGSAGGAKGGLGGAKGGGAGKLGGGLKKVGVAHTGAMVGATTMARAVSPALFKGARRFHSGGIVGGHRLAPGEVPIIARKGEGVYTPEQLAEGYKRSAGGSTVNQFDMPVNVTVNASGGTPEQNADLARKTAEETKNAMRAVVIEELVNQTRPGGIMNQNVRRY